MQIHLCLFFTIRLCKGIILRHVDIKGAMEKAIVGGVVGRMRLFHPL